MVNGSENQTNQTSVVDDAVESTEHDKWTCGYYFCYT